MLKWYMESSACLCSLQYTVSQTRVEHGIYVRGMAHEVNQIIVISHHSQSRQRSPVCDV